MTRVVFAPDSFKGTLTAPEAARALAAGWRQIEPELEAVLMPMADGGEGTVGAFAEAIPQARRLAVELLPPAPGMERVSTAWLWLPPQAGLPGGTGVIDVASTAGIELFRGKLRPWEASSYGFGTAIAAALDHGVSRLVLGIGSSASTDGGAGVLAALGARINGDPRGGARNLAGIAGVDLASLRPLPEGGVAVLTDVTNPLLGERGAAAVFGPQKGFVSSEIDDVDSALRSFAALIPTDPAIPGTGAAGGIGFALAAWGAHLTPGADAVADLIGLGPAVDTATWVVTGEGAYDAQTAAGKVPALVSSKAPGRCLLVAGRIDRGADTSRFAAVRSLSDLASSTDDALRRPAHWLVRAGRELALTVRAARGGGADIPI
jgi:glycerate kinase